MNLVRLKEHPENIPELAKIYFQTWGYTSPEKTPLDWEEMLKEESTPGAPVLPETLIATASGSLLGSATLQERTLLFPEISWVPWLAGVYVKPEHRSLGIASLLIESVEKFAINLGYGSIHLCTHEHQVYYERLGYKTVEIRLFGAQETFLMTKLFKQPA